MGGKKAFIALAAITALGALGAASAARAEHTRWWERGGFVKPCSLDGVNPAYHPGIFGNPFFARAVYGFVQGRDGIWRVIPNCHIYN
jgi:hypothetical protein